MKQPEFDTLDKKGSRSSKREYARPSLHRYGHMRDLTRAMAGSVCTTDNDGGTGDGTCHDGTDTIDV